MISIALCTYNGEQFLREQLDSIAAQTLLADELVACDDRSSDGTMEILRDFAKVVSFPIHIHQNETNLGSTRNFEKAIALCHGDIIALCDQDDIWKPHKLERLVETLRAHPQAGYVFSDANLVDEYLQPLGRCLWDSVGFNGDRKDRFLRGDQFGCLIERCIVTGATMAFRASVGKIAMPVPTDCRWIHDGWLALVSSATGRLGIAVAEPLIDYRQHPKQQIGAPGVAPVAPVAPVASQKKSLLDSYHELKSNQPAIFASWEERCLQELTLKKTLLQLQKRQNSPLLEEHLLYLQEFETHFFHRRTAMTSRGFARYPLIFREAMSGRYARFSDSWRSIFRDLFL
ncbi:MAG: glycosyltransferase family 2 protein [Anaerolineaceae bacterium]|nr:glycosyltransferase family 2 protein [Anaerolineaceae bacterium]